MDAILDKLGRLMLIPLRKYSIPYEVHPVDQEFVAVGQSAQTMDPVIRKKNGQQNLPYINLTGNLSKYKPSIKQRVQRQYAPPYLGN